jgi:hypothetical protein
MSNPEGRLERAELRIAWQNEATDFTPWMTEDDNSQSSGDALGLNLEVQEAEANVGPVVADILCRNAGDNSLVLIENQLERDPPPTDSTNRTVPAGLPY